VQDEAELDTRLGQQLDPVVQVGEQARRRLRPHHGGRVAIEDGHHRPGARRPRQGAGLAQHRLVPEVDAVERADGDHGPVGNVELLFLVAHVHRRRRYRPS